jgi:SAM-dependent methyltransferase
MSVSDHYNNFLAPLYTWMMGGTASAFERNRKLFSDVGLSPGLTRRALDLGAGSGFQSIPLANLGYAVTAVDGCDALLKELQTNASAANVMVTTVVGDMRHFIRLAPGEHDAIVCMGDTLPHLSSREEVSALLSDARRSLAPAGFFIATLRDSTDAPAGEQRFIPVRMEENRLFTCALAYGESEIAVSDLIHERESGSAWQLRVSSYRKLRLSPAKIAAELAAPGFRVDRRPLEGGMEAVIVRRVG